MKNEIRYSISENVKAKGCYHITVKIILESEEWKEQYRLAGITPFPQYLEKYQPEIYRERYFEESVNNAIKEFADSKNLYTLDPFNKKANQGRERGNKILYLSAEFHGRKKTESEIFTDQMEFFISNLKYSVLI